MTQDEIIATLKEAGFIFTFDDAYLLTSLNGLEVADLVKIAELIQAQPTPSQNEVVAWESTTEAYKKYITQQQYETFNENFQSWYKPYKSSCSQPTPSQSVDTGYRRDVEKAVKAAKKWSKDIPEVTDHSPCNAIDTLAFFLLEARAQLTKPQPTHSQSVDEHNQGEAVAIMEVISTASKHLATTTPVYKQLKMLVSYDKIPVGAKLYTKPQPTSQYVVDAEITALKCPDCDDIGWVVQADRNSEAEQCQCEFCYTQPRSIFKLRSAIDAAMKEVK